MQEGTNGIFSFAIAFFTRVHILDLLLSYLILSRSFFLRYLLSCSGLQDIKITDGATTMCHLSRGRIF